MFDGQSYIEIHRNSVTARYAYERCIGFTFVTQSAHDEFFFTGISDK